MEGVTSDPLQFLKNKIASAGSNANKCKSKRSAEEAQQFEAWWKKELPARERKEVVDKKLADRAFAAICKPHFGYFSPPSPSGPPLGFYAAQAGALKRRNMNQVTWEEEISADVISDVGQDIRSTFTASGDVQAYSGAPLPTQVSSFSPHRGSVRGYPMPQGVDHAIPEAPITLNNGSNASVDKMRLPPPVRFSTQPGSHYGPTFHHNAFLHNAAQGPRYGTSPSPYRGTALAGAPNPLLGYSHPVTQGYPPNGGLVSGSMAHPSATHRFVDEMSAFQAAPMDLQARAGKQARIVPPPKATGARSKILTPSANDLLALSPILTPPHHQGGLQSQYAGSGSCYGAGLSPHDSTAPHRDAASSAGPALGPSRGGFTPRFAPYNGMKSTSAYYDNLISQGTSQPGRMDSEMIRAAGTAMHVLMSGGGAVAASRGIPTPVAGQGDVLVAPAETGDGAPSRQCNKNAS